jgi:elongation factor Tu
MLSKHIYKFKAKITLYSTDLGGRKTPVYSGYRPSFAFNTAIHYSGEIELIGKEELQPGQSSFVNIQLLPARTIRKDLKRNDSFTITEGNKTVGTGVIEKIETD